MRQPVVDSVSGESVVRKILSFLEPTLRITYEELYDELAVHLETDREDAMARFAPDEAVPALRYFRRQQQRREDAAELARSLGIPREIVFESCTSQGAGKLVQALMARTA